MDEWICKRCNHKSGSKGNLLMHLQRKNPCKATEDHITISDYIVELTAKTYNEITFDCPNCKKKFNTKSSRDRHCKTCKKVEAKAEVNQSKDANTSQNDIMLEMRNEIKMLKNEIQMLKQNSVQVNNSMVNSNNVTNVVNNNINIEIKPLGKEDMSYFINDPEYRKKMTHFMKIQKRGLCKLLIEKHIDSANQSNNNIKKTNKKSKFMQVYNNDGWEALSDEEVLNEVFKYLESDFYEFISNELCSDDNKLKSSWIKNFIENVGLPLEWDHSMIDDNISVKDLSEKDKKILKKEIYNQAIENIYLNSKK